MLARRRTSKSQLLKKLQKSSSFSPDNQRQISLVLNHTYRNRKRLISLTNSQTFFEIIRLARWKYSKLVSVSSCSKGSVLVFEEECATIQRGVLVFVLYFYHRILWIIRCELQTSSAWRTCRHDARERQRTRCVSLIERERFLYTIT